MLTGSKTLLVGLLAAIAFVIPVHALASCWEEASQSYGIPVNVLQAVAQTESNFNASAKGRNKNGTYDIGLMQINSGWLPELSKYGLTEDSLSDPCVNLKVGAWVLANNARRLGWNWNAIGAYNVGCVKLDKEECARRRNHYAWKIHDALRNPGKKSARTVSTKKNPEPKRFVAVQLGRTVNTEENEQ
jgi:soluble lytic murein transglycosylase-like protein